MLNARRCLSISKITQIGCENRVITDYFVNTTFLNFMGMISQRSAKIWRKTLWWWADSAWKVTNFVLHWHTSWVYTFYQPQCFRSKPCNVWFRNDWESNCSAKTISFHGTDSTYIFVHCQCKWMWETKRSLNVSYVTLPASDERHVIYHTFIHF